MQTSYYAIISHSNPGAISISLKPPRGTRYKHYPALAPPGHLVSAYKHNGSIDEAGYRLQYSKILKALDPLLVWNVLHHIAGEGNEPILLCYERRGEFCHRRLVAEWFEAHLDIQVLEYEPIVASPEVEQLSLFR